jgi:hypothetical protein
LKRTASDPGAAGSTTDTRIFCCVLRLSTPPSVARTYTHTKRKVQM